ncbi:MAG: hypothetical protein ABFR05_09750 [Bacteroidota bacterium]
MKNIILKYLLIILIISTSCKDIETADKILHKTIGTIDTIETVYYKQDMIRTNPKNIDETIFRYREMHFQRLINDSIVGVKGHWYFYNEDKTMVIYEDIYDGNKLIRKNNRDSLAMVFDLIKHPEFKEKHFWSHNTPFTLQYMFKYTLDNNEYYQTDRLNDTIIQDTNCYQISIRLEDKQTMPGFAIKLEDSKGSISTTLLFINKQNYYPIRIVTKNYSKENPERKFFVDQTYYDFKFNKNINEDVQFNTSDDILTGFKTNERKP